MSGCNSNVPVKFYGQSFGDYIRGENGNAELSLGLIQRKWKLTSMGMETAPYGILLDDLNLTLHFTNELTDSAQYRFKGIAVVNGFSGDYEFDDTGNIKILTLGSTRRGPAGDKGKIEKRFMYGVRRAETYEIMGSSMRLNSQDGVLEFDLTN